MFLSLPKSRFTNGSTPVFPLPLWMMAVIFCGAMVNRSMQRKSWWNGRSAALMPKSALTYSLLYQFDGANRPGRSNCLLCKATPTLPKPKQNLLQPVSILRSHFFPCKRKDNAAFIKLLPSFGLVVLIRFVFAEHSDYEREAAFSSLLIRVPARWPGYLDHGSMSASTHLFFDPFYLAEFVAAGLIACSCSLLPEERI